MSYLYFRHVAPPWCMITDETLEVQRFFIHGYVCMLLQYLLNLKAPEPGSTEVVHPFDVRGTLHVVWSKLLKPKVAKFQSNETPKCQPKNLEVRSSREIRCKGIRIFEALEPQRSEEVPFEEFSTL
jgi:hypothetical protein